MSRIYRYTFSHSINVDDIKATLVRAILATNSLHGESIVRLDASHTFDTPKQACVIDGTTDAGRDLNRLFVGFVRCEFGEDAFRVERVRCNSDSVAGTERTAYT